MCATSTGFIDLFLRMQSNIKCDTDHLNKFCVVTGQKDLSDCNMGKEQREQTDVEKYHERETSSGKVTLSHRTARTSALSYSHFCLESNSSDVLTSQ